MTACLTAYDLDFNTLKSIIGDYSYVELRLDKLELTQQELAQLLQTPGIQFILTDRGQSNSSLMNYGLSFHPFAIDLGDELTLEEKTKWIDLARKNNVEIILSHHEFNTVIDKSTIEKIIKNFQDLGATWIKLALYAPKEQDIHTILKLYRRYNHLIAFGLGETASYSRGVAHLLGAPYVYVYDERYQSPIAEGQFSNRELKENKAYFENIAASLGI